MKLAWVPSERDNAEALAWESGATGWWRRAAFLRAVRAAPQDYPAGPHAVELSPAGLVYIVRGWPRALPWTALQDLAVARQHVFLRLAGGQVLAIPRRAFGSEAEERRVLHRVRVWRRSAPGSPLDPDAPSVDDVVLRFVLTRDDHRGLGWGRLWVAQIRGGALPTGAFEALVGPTGVRVRGPRTVSRFTWSEVSTVFEGRGITAIWARGGPALVVPDAALGSRRDTFVAACRRWRSGSSPVAGPFEVGPLRANPFAPPTP